MEIQAVDPPYFPVSILDFLCAEGALHGEVTMSDDAIQRYEKELAEDPQSRAFAPLAEAYRKAGRLDDAINTARVGLEVHSGYSAGLVVLGRALYEKGEIDSAAETLQTAVKENPENYLGQKFLGKVLMDKGETKGALSALESANFLSPEDEEVARLLDEVKSRATKPETMQYEAKETNAGPKAQIVTYEQKPTTVDGIELPPLPPGTEDEAFSFSGGGTLDPADVTPVPVDEEVVAEEGDAAGSPGDEMEVEDMTATVIEEEEVEQAMEIESLDELGPEAASFIQEGEDVLVESVDDTSDEITVADADADGEFVIEVEDMSPAETEFEVLPDPVAAPPVAGDSAPEPGMAPEPSLEPSFTEAFEVQPEPVAAPEPVPESAPAPGTGFEVDFEPATESEPGPLFIPEPEPEIKTEPEPVLSTVPEQEGSPVPGPIPTSEPAPELPPAPEPADEEQFSTETLADLYAQQGLNEKAVGMYQQILQQDPGNDAVKSKLAALQSQAQPDPITVQEAQPPAEGQAGSPGEADVEDTLSILEGLLESVERIKQP